MNGIRQPCFKNQICSELTFNLALGVHYLLMKSPPQHEPDPFSFALDIPSLVRLGLCPVTPVACRTHPTIDRGCSARARHAAVAVVADCARAYVRACACVGCPYVDW